MVERWGRVSEAPRGRRCRRKAGAPQVLAERGEQVREGDSRLGRVPGTDNPAESAALLAVGGGPQEDQAVDQPSKRSGAGDGPRRLVLGLTEAEVLLAVTEGDLNQPATGPR